MGSYASANDPGIVSGLGTNAAPRPLAGGKKRIFGPLEANRYHVLAWSAALWDESLPWLGCLGRACAAP